jgi:uncharacterized protein YuzE
MTVLSERFDAALVLASSLHRDDVRKGTSIPYIAHLLGVCELVLTDGGDEDEAIAALLHDTIEDHADRITASDIEQRFGERVRRIVEGCTDTPADYRGGQKPDWRLRKEAYIAHIARTPPADLRVSAADKLYNARAILADLREIGDRVFERFSAAKADVLWYYRSLSAAFVAAGMNGRLARQLAQTVIAIEAAASMQTARTITPSSDEGRCVHVDVPPPTCYLRFTAGAPANSDHVGTSARGEMVIFDYDDDGRILGIELVGDDKPCQS